MNTKLNFDVLDDLLADIYGFLPKLFFGILFIFFSWLLLKLLLFLIKKSLKFAKIDALTKKLNDISFLSPNFKFKPEKIILIFVKWFFILVFIIIGAELLDLELISNQVGKLLGYLPKFFSALTIFIFGLYGATYLKKSLQSLLRAIDVGGSKIVSNILFIVLAVFISIISLNQAGINTDIITSNLLLIIGAVLAAFTIAFGLGSRDLIFRLLLGFYAKKTFQVGQCIKIDNKEGVISAIDNITMIVVFADNKVVYPIKHVTNSKVEIIG
ncbi:mechanosensitive ion channel family protein [Bizionia sp. KMM 8389]